MKEQLAERLLAKVMRWRPEDIAAERPILQALARYKYDEYQQFRPGQKFIESLALWLDCMSDANRKIAYEFVRSRLVFISAAEMRHFITAAYPYFIKPHLLRTYAEINGHSAIDMRRIRNSVEFKAYEASTLFLGLSDGSRTDIFRRANDTIVTHEQILPSYEIRDKRVPKLLKKLRERKEKLTGCNSVNAKFHTVVLLDDFSASGTSYLRKEDDGTLDGKLNELANDFRAGSEISNLIDVEQSNFLLVLYVATQQAADHLTQMAAEVPLFQKTGFRIEVVHPISSDTKIQEGDVLDTLLDEHYDPVVEDKHTGKGGSGVKYGYAKCGLPLILTHNTPNNSIFPLWCHSPTLRPLFPRSVRHNTL